MQFGCERKTMSKEKDFMKWFDKWVEDWVGENITFPVFKVAQEYKKGTLESDKAMHETNARVKEFLGVIILESYQMGRKAKKK